MSIAPDALRVIMRAVPAPVGVVVVESSPGVWRGMTASSLTSVSLSPPLISLNVMRGSQMHGALLDAERFTFNLLSAEQRALASRFATRRLSPREQFAGVACRSLPSGALVLEGAVSWLLCTLHTRFEAGDHTIVIGEVQDAALAAEPGAREPLVVLGGTFHSVGHGTGLADDDTDSHRSLES